LHLRTAAHHSQDDVPNDFAPRVKSAIQQVTYDSAYKIAWESRRFWEQDGDEIYGGLSFLTTGPFRLSGIRARS
jgi:monoamine oxidase